MFLLNFYFKFERGSEDQRKPYITHSLGNKQASIHANQNLKLLVIYQLIHT